MKDKVLHNLLWRFFERVGAQFISFVVTIVLARILTPDDYGVVALLTVITSILQVFVDGGFGNALIQKKDADDLDFSSVFYFNIFFCTLLYLLIYIFAPLVGAFYNNLEMIAMLRVLALIILISGVKNIQQAYISKTLQFKRFFFATLFGTIISAFVGITLAIKGAGVWALIAQTLTNTVIDTIVVWITVDWRPKFIFSIVRLKSLFSYGWKLLLSTVLDTLYGNIRQLLIGKIYTSSDLAYYNRGRYIPNLIVTNVNTSIDSVLFPAMSSRQENTDVLKNMARRSITTSNFIMAPLMMGIVFMADPIVRLVLTDKWLPCVPFVRIFCFLYMFQPIHTVNTNIIKALGRSDIRLKQEIITKVIGLILLLISLRWGVLAIAYAYLVGNFFNQYVNAYPNKELLGYSYLAQLRDIMPSTVLAVAMGAIVYFISFFKLSLVVQIVLQVATGAFVYVIGAIILRIESFYYIFDIIKNFRRKQNGN